MSTEDYAIGIDLGTTYSCVAVYKNNQVEIITNELGNRTTPSYVAFLDQEDTSELEILVGESAKLQANNNIENTIYDIKRLIGLKYDDKSVRQDSKQWGFKLINNLNDLKNQDNISIQVNNINLTPVEISSYILKKLKSIAEDYLGVKVNKAVITVPAYFNDNQRQLTKDAGELAGLQVLRILNEPTAAALAYGLEKFTNITSQKIILILDYGGGTTDVSLLRITDGLYEVISTSGNTHLGGDDLDSYLVIHSMKEFIKSNNINQDELIKNNKVLYKLRTACEEAKRKLSTSNTTQIYIDSLYDNKDLNLILSRSKFEDLCGKELDKCLICIKQVLQDGKIEKDQVDDIVLVGGSTRIPYVQKIIQNYFNKEPKLDINPDEAIAHGAAIQAAMLNNKNTHIQDKYELTLIDVAPLSLGIETNGGAMCKIINRNTPIPCKKEHIFTTYSDNQPSITVKIYEGERILAVKNNLLGVFKLEELPPRPRGTLHIKVVFSINADGILQVTACEESKNISNKIIVNKIKEQDIKNIIKKEDLLQDSILNNNIITRQKYEFYIQEVKNKINKQDMKERLGEESCKKINMLLNDSILHINNKKNYLEDNLDEKYLELQKQVNTIFESIYQK